MGEMSRSSATEGAAFVPSAAPSSLSPLQSSILEALDKPRGIDDLARIIAADPGQLRAEITILELRKRVARKGTILERIAPR